MMIGEMSIGQCACGSPLCKYCNPNIWKTRYTGTDTEKIAYQQAEINRLTAGRDALRAELAGLQEDVKLPDIEAIGAVRLRVRRISRMEPPVFNSEEG